MIINIDFPITVDLARYFGLTIDSAGIATVSLDVELNEKLKQDVSTGERLDIKVEFDDTKGQLLLVDTVLEQQNAETIKGTAKGARLGE